LDAVAQAELGQDPAGAGERAVIGQGGQLR
jgi:hypothetical protein